jgi:lysophospholipase L1-like esterase
VFKWSGVRTDRDTYSSGMPLHALRFEQSVNRERWTHMNRMRELVGCVVAVISLISCSNTDGSSTNSASGEGSDTMSPSGGPSPTAEPLQLVALGDSIIYGDACPGCALFVDQYAKAWSKQTGEEVEVSNLAVPGAEVAQLLDAVRSDELRDALGGADAVVVTIGINDLPFNQLDDPCRVAANYPVIEWSQITKACTNRVADQYRRDLDAVMAQINDLRQGRPTLLRVTTVYNSVIGDHVDRSWDSPEAVAPSVYAVERYTEAQCEVAKANGGECADTYHALNGHSGRDPAGEFLAADYTHLAQKGHDAFAKALIATGFDPTR